MKKLLLSLGMVSALSLCAGVGELNGVFRNGQVFLQWKESNLAKDTRLSVWKSDKPITRENVSKAVRVASLLNVNSSRDWWLDPDSFVIKRSRKAKGEEIFAGNVTDVGEQKKQVRGFVIENNGKPIPADGGLHVHTPEKAGRFYFAVTTHKGFSDSIVDFTASGSAIECGKGKAVPIRLNGKLTANSGKGLPLIISLHGRGGGVGVDKKGREVGNHIIFSDSNTAWREGIPFKFTVYVSSKNGVQISLNDRVWIGRILTKNESRDSRDYVPAISTFWLGYNVNIAKSNEGPKYVWDNYTERLIIHIAKWAQDHLGADKNRTYITGGSMGGSGTVQMVTHYPEFFAAGFAQVPIYAYSWAGGKHNSAWRMTCSIGQFTSKNPALMPDGTDLVDYSNGAKYMGNAAVDMPPLFATNGRKDSSIPWINNPPFYRAANQGRQMFTVFWNNGNHGMSKQTPKDFNMRSKMMRYRLDESFPAFSNLSDNKNYGNGDSKDGDLVGWINRGIDWKVIADTPDRYEITLSVSHPQIKYPVTSDVTIRRRQQFKPEKGTAVNVEINGRKSKAVIDENGLLTIKNITFANSGKVRVICTR